MKKYIVIGKNSQETAASMLNKPQNRREMVEPLVKSFNAEVCEFTQDETTQEDQEVEQEQI